MSADISPEGLRCDGRRANELRSIEINIGTVKSCDGSAFYGQGNTQVIASIHGPWEQQGASSSEVCNIFLFVFGHFTYALLTTTVQSKLRISNGCLFYHGEKNHYWSAGQTIHGNKLIVETNL